MRALLSIYKLLKMLGLRRKLLNRKAQEVLVALCESRLLNENLGENMTTNFINDIENPVIHRLIYHITWDMQKELPKEWLPVISESLSDIAGTKRWMLHDLKVDQHMVAMTLQTDPTISIERVVRSFQRVVTKILIQEFALPRNTRVWGEVLEIKTVGNAKLMAQ